MMDGKGILNTLLYALIDKHWLVFTFIMEIFLNCGLFLRKVRENVRILYDEKFVYTFH